MSINQIYLDERKPWLNGRFENLTVDGEFIHSGDTGINVCSINCDETLTIHGATGVHVSTDGTSTNAINLSATSGGVIVDSGSVDIFSSNADADSIQLNAQSGGIDFTASSGNVVSDSGAFSVFSSNTDADSILLDAQAGGIELKTVASKKVKIYEGAAVHTEMDSTGVLTTAISNFGGQGVNCPNGVVIPSPKGILIASDAVSDGTVAGNVVTVDGTCGKITDSGPAPAGDRLSITVHNPQVTATSRVFLQVLRGANGISAAPLTLDVENLGGFGGFGFTIEVTNSTVNPTSFAPIYQYLVINS